MRVLTSVSDLDSYIHNDWSDIKALQVSNNLAWLSVGRANGSDSIIEAAKRAMSAFSGDSLALMNAVCISIVCSRHGKLQKVSSALDDVRACVQPDVSIA